MVSFRQTIGHNAGIPLGGVGTGSVEIRPDGLFHEWQIFNNGAWSPGSPCCGSDASPMNPEDMLFVIRTKTAGGKILVRYLALREQLHDLYTQAWARSIEAIEFDGTFPLATLTYHDSELPVRVQAEVFSPFIPLDSRSSGNPGFYVYFTVKNLTPEPVDVSIMGITKNAAGYNQEKRRAVNRLVDIGDAKAIVMTAEGLDEGHCSTGDMTFAALGGDISYITGAYSEDHKCMTFFKNLLGGLKGFSYLRRFRDEGKLPNLNSPRQLRYAKGLSADKITEQHRKELLQEFLQYPVFYEKYHKVKAADPELVESPEFLDGIIKNVEELEERNIQWGWGALCSSMELQADSESEVLFALGWYFPNHISPTKENIGHQYEHWFGSSSDVVQFMLDNFTNLRSRTLALPDSIHSSSLPEEAADAITGQLSTMTKCTWWTRSGHFGVWEGLGCCGFHTTDITYQGSFPIISLFPDLQKMQMEHGAKFQREDGRVHHFFTPDFSKVDEGFDRVDMNPQFVMLAARDYLWTGDKSYLERLWPNIIKAMDNAAELDTDGDGLPDTDTRRNTYDAWDFQGCPSYISSLWLGSLKAGVRLAEEMGDGERARSWQEIYDKGVKSFEEKLWNGEYYVLWRDGDAVDECCMSDQMSGDWFAAASGWDNICDIERTQDALDAIMRYNFLPGEGLKNASYPPGKKHRLAASGNFQAEAPWTGIEYTVAALLIDQFNVSDGMAIVKDIHDRYLRAGRFWSHVECGPHYYRAMSSWTLLNAFSGFRWDQPQGSLSFAPKINEPYCEYPFFTSLAWGTYKQQISLAGNMVHIQLEEGEMTLDNLSLMWLGKHSSDEVAFDEAKVIIDRQEIECKLLAHEEGVFVKFPKSVTLTPEMPLTIVKV